MKAKKASVIDLGDGVTGALMPFWRLRKYMDSRVYVALRSLSRYSSWDDLLESPKVQLPGFRCLNGHGQNKEDSLKDLGRMLQTVLETVVPEKVSPSLIMFEDSDKNLYPCIYMILSPEEADAFDLVTKERG